MAAMIGSDPDQLDALAHDLNGAAEQLRAAGLRVGTRLHAVPWSGPDAEALRADWDGGLFRSIDAAASGLQEAATVMTRNAAEQRITSQADGATTGAGTVTSGSAVAVTAAAGSAVTGSALAAILPGAAGGSVQAVPRLPAGLIRPATGGLSLRQDAAQAWDDVVRWANTPQELPNSEYVSAGVNLVWGGLKFDAGAGLLVAGAFTGPFGLPVDLYSGYQLVTGSSRVWRGGQQYLQAREGPQTEVATPLEYGQQILTGIVPGGNSTVDFVGGLF